MIEIVCTNRGLYFTGVLFIDGIRVCDCIINRDKHGDFPYDTDKIYELEFFKDFRYSITLPSNEAFNRRGFQVHTGNKIEDSKGCVLVGYHPYLMTSDSFDFSQLQMSRYAFKLVLYNVCYHCKLKFSLIY